MPITKKIEKSDIAISNDKDEKNLIKQLQKNIFEYLWNLFQNNIYYFRLWINIYLTINI